MQLTDVVSDAEGERQQVSVSATPQGDALHSVVDSSGFGTIPSGHV